MMHQLDLSIVSPPRTLHELKQDGRAFVVQTDCGWSVWLPFHPGWIAGMYFKADGHEDATAAADEFNQQLTAEKGST